MKKFIAAATTLFFVLGTNSIADELVKNYCTTIKEMMSLTVEARHTHPHWLKDMVERAAQSNTPNLSLLIIRKAWSAPLQTDPQLQKVLATLQSHEIFSLCMVSHETFINLDNY